MHKDGDHREPTRPLLDLAITVDQASGDLRMAEERYHDAQFRWALQALSEQAQGCIFVLANAHDLLAAMDRQMLSHTGTNASNAASLIRQMIVSMAYAHEQGVKIEWPPWLREYPGSRVTAKASPSSTDGD